MKKIKLIIAENNQKEMGLFISSINNYNNFEISYKAISGQDLIKHLHTTKYLPDIILMDVAMPDGDGLCACIYIKNKFPTIKILAISSHTHENVIVQMLAEGADNFISKYHIYVGSIVVKSMNLSPQFLYNAINSTLKNEKIIDISLCNHVDKLKIPISTTTIISQHFPFLKEVHLEFLRLLNCGFTYEDISILLNRSKETIKKIALKLFEYFNVKDKQALIHHCHCVGILKVPQLYDEYFHLNSN